MHVGVRALALALEIFAANETAVYVERADRDRALLMKVKVQHVSPDLPEVRTAVIFLRCWRFGGTLFARFLPLLTLVRILAGLLLLLLLAEVE